MRTNWCRGGSKRGDALAIAKAQTKQHTTVRIHVYDPATTIFD